MANLRDAATLVTGQVVLVEPIKNRETLAVEAQKVTILAGDGFAVVKMMNLDIEHSGVFPAPGMSVAWFIRNAAYAVEGNSGMSTRFVRVATDGDLDMVASLIANSTGHKAKTAA